MNPIHQRIEEWEHNPYYDLETRRIVASLKKDHPQELNDRFSSDLSFGTGGLRALMGVGTARLNIYTIRKTTQGVAHYILKKGSYQKGVLIGFDARHNSKLFAEETASVLAGNGIPVFLLSDIRPTPFISFGCRYKKCQAAIMITASHNPKEYNGYKVYWSDGAQVVPPHDLGIMQEIHALSSVADIKLAPSSSLICRLHSELDEPYIQELIKLQHFPQMNHKEGSSLKIVYTSLHGTGITLMPQALKAWGFTNYHFVDRQVIPDGDFPTVKFPNPEYVETLKLGIESQKSHHADLLIATDPDADRLAVSVLHKGVPVVLTGNEMAAICAYFLCDTLKQQKKLSPHSALITTIVTTDLLKEIAESYGISCFETLTGFKYIGEKIHEWERLKEPYSFIFGAEESYGFLIGSYARDKDGISAGCLLAEIALYLKRNNKTLISFLHEVYSKFGIFRERQKTFDFEPGEQGLNKIQKTMKALRSSPPSHIGTNTIISIQDLKKSNTLKLPPSDVLILSLDNQSKLIIRPSGTEPKIKIYASCHLKSPPSVEEGLRMCDQTLTLLLENLEKEIG